MASILETMQSFINNTENEDALVKIFASLPLQSKKEMLSTKPQDLDQSDIRSSYFRSFPLDHVLSNDVVQSVLKFIPYQSSSKLVNTNFNTLMGKNDKSRVQTNETDWTAIVKTKKLEILRLEGIKYKFIRECNVLIEIFQSDLNKMTDAILEKPRDSNWTLLFCRACFKRKPIEDMAQCQKYLDGSYGPIADTDKQCKNMECKDCIKDCGNYAQACETMYCGSCKFKTKECGILLCDWCSDYHAKNCNQFPKRCRTVRAPRRTIYQ